MALGGTCPLEPNKSRPLAPGAESGASTRPQQWCRRGAPKMARAPQPLSLLILLVLVATAQGQAATGSKVLEPWLLGLTAVIVFLFIVFVLLLVNRLWRIRMRRKRGDVQDTLGTGRLDRVGHVNPAAEQESDEESDDEKRNKATPL